MAGLGKHSWAMPRHRLRGITAAALAVIAGTLVFVGLHGDLGSAENSTASRTDPARGAVTRPPIESLTAKPGMASKSRVRPARLKIPAIQVSSDVTRLGLNEDDTVEVPSDPAKVGWYSLGPTPGQPGSSVMLGHRDSKQGAAVFYRLGNLKPADRVAVRLSDRAIAHFEVTRVVSYANEKFPARKIYDGTTRRPVLNLVTCGGAYERAAGGYQSNVVVYTKYLWTSNSDT
jgi:sortase (surface protein transpeptidase)